MLGRGRLVALLGVALIVAVLGADWAQARARVGRITIEGVLDPPVVVADGQHSTTLRLRVTEEGRPRANDTLQLWIEPGGGLLIPDWLITEENGEAQTVYTPNPLSQYDLERDTVINVIDINVGRLIEVRKQFSIPVELEVPTD